MNDEFENTFGPSEGPAEEVPVINEAPPVQAAPAAAESPVNSAPETKSAPKKEKKRISAGGIFALALCCLLLGAVLGLFGSRYVTFPGAEPAARVQTQVAEASSAIENNQTAAAFNDVTSQPAPEDEDDESDAVDAASGESEAAGTPEDAADAKAEAAEAGTEPSGSAETAAIPARVQMSAADVYAATVRSTVGITTSISASNNYWGYQSTSSASGSGFILTADGYVLTNYHVVEDAQSVTVTTYDNVNYDAEVIGYDADNDIAVLKVDADDLSPVTLGSSNALRVGDEVIAIGNPLGELTFSLTKGVVSALNRAVTLENGATMDLIQTDTAINSGNSGGALFNMYGEVVGITNAKYSSSGFGSSASIDNIGFAIPIDSVRNNITSIIEYGYIVKPYIGVSVGSNNSPQGAWVQSIVEGSPADDSDLQVDDVITAANGQAVTTSSDLVRIVSACLPGDELRLTVYRQNIGELEITIIVGEQQKSATEDTSSSSDQSQQQNGSTYGYGYGSPFGEDFSYYGYGSAE